MIASKYFYQLCVLLNIDMLTYQNNISNAEFFSYQANRQKQPVRRTNAVGSLPPGASSAAVSPQQISTSAVTGGSPTTSGHGGSPAGAALAAVSAMLRSLNVPKVNIENQDVI